MNPVKFMMWAFLVTVTMLFAAFTSALIVSRADAVAAGKWVFYEMPVMFYISTTVIALSSASMQGAYFAARVNNVSIIRLLLFITFLLGGVFIFLQIEGYRQLFEQGVTFVGESKAGPFFYVISGMHALHVIGGLFFLIATLIHAFQYKVHSKNLLRINVCTTYWHFLGALWIYLFVILNFFR